VAPEVAGSNPVAHPIYTVKLYLNIADMLWSRVLTALAPVQVNL